VSNLHDRLVGLPDDVGCEERDDLVIVFDRQIYQSLQVVFKDCLLGKRLALDYIFMANIRRTFR
jgi:hypothetical protein